jgi:hypothetical protein
MEKQETPSIPKRVFLILVGVVALCLDKLEGKSSDPQPVTTGRIEIVE